MEVVITVVEEVEVEVVILSRGSISPRDSLYTLPDTPAEVFVRLRGLIALM